MRRIGIDVGGTNTDAVLLDGDKVVFAVKRPTTKDVTSGILDALKALRADPAARVPVDAVVIGTTHFINAVVQRRHLMKVAAIRIGMPASASLPPFCDWPQDLAEGVRGEIFMLEGGHDYDGRPIVPGSVPNSGWVALNQVGAAVFPHNAVAPALAPFVGHSVRLKLVGSGPAYSFQVYFDVTVAP